MKKSQSGFSLLELLVVIAIMASLASAVALGVRSGLRNAHAARCQMHMQQLHRAMFNHLADKTYYPPARSFLHIDPVDNNIYEFYRGWVNWVGGDPEGYGSPKHEKNKKNDRLGFHYVGCGEKAAKDELRQSIAWGALFKYVGKDYSTYFCREFANGKKSKARRTYALNSWFGGADRDDFYRDYCLGTKTMLQIDSTRLAMFVELAESGGTSQKDAKGASNLDKKDPTNDDSSWDWNSGKVSKGKASGEPLGAWHRKNGKMYGHVIFMDGHIESLSADDCKNSEVIKNLGKGLR